MNGSKSWPTCSGKILITLDEYDARRRKIFGRVVIFLAAIGQAFSLASPCFFASYANADVLIGTVKPRPFFA